MDRDGVINKDRPDYVKSWSEFEFLPGSLDALKLLTLNGYHIILVTNQSVINRRMVTEARLQEIHEKMTDALRTIRRHRLLFAVGLVVIAVLLVIVFYKPSGTENISAKKESGPASPAAKAMRKM